MSASTDMPESEMFAENVQKVKELDQRDEQLFEDAQTTLKRTNWLSAFFNPFGSIPTVVFTRGQIILWIVRIVVFILGLVISLGGQKQVGGMLIVVGFGASALVSMIMHMQRLENAGRQTWLAFIAIIPMLLAAWAASSQLQAIGKQIEQMKAAMAGMENMQKMQAANGQAGAPAEATPPAAEGEATEGQPAAEGEATPDGETQAGQEGEASQQGQQQAQQRQQGQRRGGPPGGGRGGPQQQPPLALYVIFGIVPWAGAGILVSFFTWMYVAPAKRKARPGEEHYA